MKVELDKTGMVHLGYREKEVWYWDEAELKKLDNPQLYTLYKELRY